MQSPASLSHRKTTLPHSPARLGSISDSDAGGIVGLFVWVPNRGRNSKHSVVIQVFFIPSFVCGCVGHAGRGRRSAQPWRPVPRAICYMIRPLLQAETPLNQATNCCQASNHGGIDSGGRSTEVPPLAIRVQLFKVAEYSARPLFDS